MHSAFKAHPQALTEDILSSKGKQINPHVFSNYFK